MVSREPAFKLAGVNVLVLDASAQIRARLQALLAEAGDVEVLEASDAEAALALLTTFQIDLVVLDVHLSTNGGLEVLRRIRQRAPRTVSIVLTNEANEHHRRECLSHGADFFFDKSRHFERVVAIVEQVANRASRKAAARSLESGLRASAACPTLPETRSDTRISLEPMPFLEARPYEWTMTQEGPYQRELVLSRFLLEGFADPLVVLNEHAAVVDANRPANEASGFDIVALFEQAGDDELIREFLGQLREQGSATLELQRVMKKGGVGQFLLKGEQIGAYSVVVVRDFTERRTLDEEVRQLRRMQSLGFIAASVIHDFNNLMVPIRCLSELLSKELEPASPAAGLAADVRFAAERAASLVRDVHALTRARTSALEPLDLSAVILEMRALVDRMLGGNIDLELSLEQGLGEAVVDRERLENAVLNLIANARDAMPHGGRLTISTANVAFAGGPGGDDASSPPGYVALIVEDSGIGMTDDVRARVFDRFYTTKHPGSGSGLGLASVQRFVTESGGLIALHSEPGRGTTITIHLPRVGRRERPTIPDIQLRDSHGDGNETVLVVDRDEPVRRTVKAVLQARGYRVVEACSAEKALSAAQNGTLAIDLALVDTALPRTDMPRFLEQLGKAGGGMRIVLMSTEERPANLPISVLGARFLRKAFSEQELVRAARAALDRDPDRRASSERRAD